MYVIFGRGFACLSLCARLAWPTWPPLTLTGAGGLVWAQVLAGLGGEAGAARRVPQQVGVTRGPFGAGLGVDSGPLDFAWFASG